LLPFSVMPAKACIQAPLAGFPPEAGGIVDVMTRATFIFIRDHPVMTVRGDDGWKKFRISSVVV